MTDDVFRLLAEPTRRRILQLTADGELTASSIASHFPSTRQAVSQHIQVLVGAGLLAERRDGTRRWYRTDPARFAEVVRFLDAFWGSGLDRLKADAERDLSGESDI